jgi:hypothetical protein
MSARRACDRSLPRAVSCRRTTASLKPAEQGRPVTDTKPQVPLGDNYAVTMFSARALDLLAPSESQHRVVIEAHPRLDPITS